MNDCSNIKTGGSFTVTVDRIGATGEKQPFQLFGALDGIHKVAQDSGVLVGYVPDQYRAGSVVTKTARFDPNGALEILDTVTGKGVRIQSNKIPMRVLLDFMASQGTPNSPVITIASTKLTYTTETSRGEQLTVRNRSYFELLKDTNYDIDDYFDENQQQSNLVRIDEVIDISPATRIDSQLAETETKLTFTFTLQVM